MVFCSFWMLDFEGRTYPRWDCAPGEMGEFFIDPIWNSFWDLPVYEDPIDCEPDTWFSAVPIVFMVFNDVFSGEVLNCFKSWVLRLTCILVWIVVRLSLAIHPWRFFRFPSLRPTGEWGGGKRRISWEGRPFFWCLAWVSAIPSRNFSTSRPERPRPGTCNCSLESKSKQAEE